MYCSFASIGYADIIWSTVSSDCWQSLHLLSVSVYYYYYYYYFVIVIITIFIILILRTMIQASGIGWRVLYLF